MIKLTNNIYYTEPIAETDRPTMGYVNGEKASLMIEAGNSAKTTAEFNSELHSLGLKPADYVVITHHHWDHSFGIASLDAVSIALDKTNELLKNMSGWKWSDEMLTEYVAADKFPLFCEPHIRLEYPDLTDIKVKCADVVFDTDYEIDLGGIRCIFKKVTSPHTDECIIVYIPEEKVVFFGDSLCEELVRDEWIDNKEKLSVLIKELEKIDFEIGLEGHFEPKTKATIMKELKARL